MVQAGLLVGGILLILGVALGLTNYLVDARIPEPRRSTGSPAPCIRRWAFLLAAQPVPARRRVLPRHLLGDGRARADPAAARGAFGIDPVHLGIIFLANLELGYLTPPVGMNLFFAAYRFGKPLPEVFRAVLPPLLVLAGGVLLVTFVPWLSTGLLARLQ